MVDCAEVMSLAPTADKGSRPDDPSTATPQVKALLIVEKVDGFFLKRLSANGEYVRTTQHDTMDEAMHQAYSEYVLSEWRRCPEDVDPLTYISSTRASPDLPEATPGD
jgi:hypothetical protein